MEPYQQRVVDEHNELKERLAKLQAFIESERFSTVQGDEQRLLILQRCHMESLVEIIGQRIALFNRAVPVS